MATTSLDPTALTGGTTTVDYPDWWTQSMAGMGSALSGLVGPTGQIQNTYNNWYSDTAPLTADWNAQQQAALTGTNTAGAWTPNINNAIGQTGAASTWNADTQQQFMNPYMTNVVDEMTRRSNQNLFQNVLPGVNSTFTGAGQFGSTRNSDFMNRAITDQQQQLTGNIGNQLYQGQNAAAGQYADWANRGLTGAGQIGSLATAGAGLDQQNWQNLLNVGKERNTWEQGQLDRSKADWLQQSQYPLQQYGALGQVYNTLRGGVPTGTTVTKPTDSGLTDAQKIAALTGVLSLPGLNTGTGTDVLAELFKSLGITTI